MKIKVLLTLLAVFSSLSCQIKSKRDLESGFNAPLVDPKYSIAKDRAELAQLREAIPAEIKNKNDEKALMADLMGELKYTPEIVREKFTNIFHKKRDLFNKDMLKSREDFNKKEKKDRDVFLKSLEDERDDFLRRKVDRDKRASFFNDQDEARRTFFAEQREKRDEYESDVREKRKNFEDYLKEKTDEFNAEYSEYALRWKEKEKTTQGN